MGTSRNRPSFARHRDIEDRSMRLGEARSRAPRDLVMIPDVEDQGAIDLTTVIDGADGQTVDTTAGLNVRTGALRHYRLIGALLIVLDLLCLTLALLAAHALRFDLITDPN